MTKTDTLPSDDFGNGNSRGNQIPSFLLVEKDTPVHSVWRFIVRKISRNPEMPITLGELLRIEKPIGVGTEINNVCNAKCSFCGYGKGQGDTASDPRKKSKLDVDVHRHTLRLFSEAGGGLYYLSPILGEISADKRWLDLIREARSYPNITGVACFSNAILFDRFGSEAILTSGLTSMNISTALGSPDQYRRLYGVDKYDHVVANIIDLLEANNRLERPVTIQLMLRQDKPFESFYQSPLYVRLAALAGTENIHLLDDYWDDFKGLVAQDELPDGHRFVQLAEDKTQPCYALHRKLMVMMDGTIQGCSCRVEPELWAGNIKDYDTLQAAWRNPELERIRNDWKQDGKIPSCCTKCTHYIPVTNLLTSVTPEHIMHKVSAALRRRLKRLVPQF
jgi:radical SAM protein with 4Fe4S-binding SPASM domain